MEIILQVTVIVVIGVALLVAAIYVIDKSADRHERPEEQ
jgi:hypothetical protein